MDKYDNLLNELYKKHFSGDLANLEPFTYVDNTSNGITIVPYKQLEFKLNPPKRSSNKFFTSPDTIFLNAVVYRGAIGFATVKKNGRK